MPASIESEIERAVEELLRGKVADTVPEFRARTVLEHLAHRVDQNARAEVLLSLLTVDDVARQLHVTPRRIRAKAKWARERGFPCGWQIPGTTVWLFRPEDLERLRPEPKGRPKGYSPKPQAN